MSLDAPCLEILDSDDHDLRILDSADQLAHCDSRETVHRPISPSCMMGRQILEKQKIAKHKARVGIQVKFVLCDSQRWRKGTMH